MRLKATLFAVLASAGTDAAIAQAQSPQTPLVQALAQCRTQTNDAERLRCYDAAAAALTEATQRDDVVLVDKEDVRRTRRSLFGFSLPKLPFFSGDRSANEQPDEITAKVASASSLGHGKWRIRLEDGAQWETTEALERNPPRSGGQVTIRRGAMGGYFIKVGDRRGVRGRRIG